MLLKWLRPTISQRSPRWRQLRWLWKCCIFRRRRKANNSRTILLVILGPGSARHPHVLRVRSGGCALAGPKLTSPITSDNGMKSVGRIRRSRRHPAVFKGYLIPSALMRSRICCARSADAG
ncbi:hypothetical protein FDW94_13550 [Citrobacter sp. wls757]|nr:hypothetical protein FDW94_13550 [Citrobacter sp. wls757]